MHQGFLAYLLQGIRAYLYTAGYTVEHKHRGTVPRYLSHTLECGMLHCNTVSVIQEYSN
jgi:hypothetical protein